MHVVCSVLETHAEMMRKHTERECEVRSELARAPVTHPKVNVVFLHVDLFVSI